MQYIVQQKTGVRYRLSFRIPRSPFRVGFRGFTLIELLVVIAIIITLLAILMPSMNQALLVAERSRCVVNQRSITHALISYASDNVGTFPSRTMPGVAHFADAYGYRTDYPYSGSTNRGELGLGLLVKVGALPTEGLGDLIHCPSLDNLATWVKGHCMNVAQPWGRGGDWWTSEPGRRITGGYNYRGTGYQVTHGRPPKASDIDSGFVMLMDTPDMRFRGTQGALNAHGGYNHVFADGSARWLQDNDSIVDTYALLSGGNGTVDGRRGNDEPLFEYVGEAED